MAGSGIHPPSSSLLIIQGWLQASSNGPSQPDYIAIQHELGPAMLRSTNDNENKITSVPASRLISRLNPT